MFVSRLLTIGIRYSIHIQTYILQFFVFVVFKCGTYHCCADIVVFFFTVFKFMNILLVLLSAVFI